jgi:hypothetical protein
MGDTTLDKLKQLITTLAADISTIKADQARLHVAVNKALSEVVGDGSSSSGPKGKVIAGDGSSGPGPTTSHKLFPQVRWRLRPAGMASAL